MGKTFSKLPGAESRKELKEMADIAKTSGWVGNDLNDLAREGRKIFAQKAEEARKAAEKAEADRCKAICDSAEKTISDCRKAAEEAEEARKRKEELREQARIAEELARQAEEAKAEAERIAAEKRAIGRKKQADRERSAEAETDRKAAEAPVKEAKARKKALYGQRKARKGNARKSFKISMQFFGARMKHTKPNTKGVMPKGSTPLVFKDLHTKQFFLTEEILRHGYYSPEESLRRKAEAERFNQERKAAAEKLKRDQEVALLQAQAEYEADKTDREYTEKVKQAIVSKSTLTEADISRFNAKYAEKRAEIAQKVKGEKKDEGSSSDEEETWPILSIDCINEDRPRRWPIFTAEDLIRHRKVLDIIEAKAVELGLDVKNTENLKWFVMFKIEYLPLSKVKKTIESISKIDVRNVEQCAQWRDDVDGFGRWLEKHNHGNRSGERILNELSLALTSDSKAIEVKASKISETIVEACLNEMVRMLGHAVKANKIKGQSKLAYAAANSAVLSSVIDRFGLNQTTYITVGDKNISLCDALINVSKAMYVGKKDEAEALLKLIFKKGFDKYNFPTRQLKPSDADIGKLFPGNLYLDFMSSGEDMSFASFDIVGMTLFKLIAEAIVGKHRGTVAELWHIVAECIYARDTVNPETGRKGGFGCIQLHDELMKRREMILTYIRYGHLDTELARWCNKLHDGWYDRLVFAINKVDKNGNPIRVWKSPFSLEPYAMEKSSFEESVLPIILGVNASDLVNRDILKAAGFTDEFIDGHKGIINEEDLDVFDWDADTKTSRMVIYNGQYDMAWAKLPQIQDLRDKFFSQFLKKSNIYRGWWKYNKVELPATIGWRKIFGSNADPASCVITEYMNTEEFRESLLSWMEKNRDWYEGLYKEDFAYYDNRGSICEQRDALKSWDVYPTKDAGDVIVRELQNDLWGKTLALKVEHKWLDEHPKDLKTCKRIFAEWFLRFKGCSIDEHARVIENNSNVVNYDNSEAIAQAISAADDVTLKVVTAYASAWLGEPVSEWAVKSIVLYDEHGRYDVPQADPYIEKTGYVKYRDSGYCVRRLLSLWGRYIGVANDISEKIYRMVGVMLSPDQILTVILAGVEGYSLVDNLLESRLIAEKTFYAEKVEKATAHSPRLRKEIKASGAFLKAFGGIRLMDDPTQGIQTFITMFSLDRKSDVAIGAMTLADLLCPTVEHGMGQDAACDEALKAVNPSHMSAMRMFWLHYVGENLSVEQFAEQQADELICVLARIKAAWKWSRKARVKTTAHTSVKAVKVVRVESLKKHHIFNMVDLLKTIDDEAMKDLKLTSSIYDSKSFYDMAVRIAGDSAKNKKAEYAEMAEYKDSVENIGEKFEIGDDTSSEELLNDPDKFRKEEAEAGDAAIRDFAYKVSYVATPLAIEAMRLALNAYIFDEDLGITESDEYYRWTPQMADELEETPWGESLIKARLERAGKEDAKCGIIRYKGKFYLPLVDTEEEVFEEWVKEAPDTVPAFVCPKKTFKIEETVMQVPEYRRAVDAMRYTMDRYGFIAKAPLGSLEAAVVRRRGINKIFNEGVPAFAEERARLDHILPVRTLDLNETQLKLGYLGREFYGKGIKVCLADYIVKVYENEGRIPDDAELDKRLSASGVTKYNIAAARKICDDMESGYLAAHGALEEAISKAYENFDMRPVYGVLLDKFVSPIDVLAEQGRENWSSDLYEEGVVDMFDNGEWSGDDYFDEKAVELSHAEDEAFEEAFDAISNLGI